LISGTCDMRIMSFAKRWDKLGNGIFTTFRYPRKDRDWSPGEKVQVFIKNRSPHRVFLGIAEILSKVPRALLVTDDPAKYGRKMVTHEEAKSDGFEDIRAMESFMLAYYGKDYSPDFNKLTLRWI
jgi:hypothetical protein